MKRKHLGFIIAGLMSGPMAAHAQYTTLDYQGALMTGTSTYLPTGFTYPTNGDFPVLPSESFSETLTAQIVLSGSLAANNLNLVSFTLDGAPPLDQAPLVGGGGTSWCSASGSCVNLTFAGDSITGATVDIVENGYIGQAVAEWTIGPNGDSVTSLYSLDGTCENQIPLGGTYTGPLISQCSVMASNKIAGVWSVTNAPEIDPASAASGLTLLLGGLAVFRGRRVRPSQLSH